MEDIEDDSPQLSAEALQALSEFISEQNASAVTGHIDENWGLSQFWYTNETSDMLARECLSVVGENGSIACISCPSVYSSLSVMKPVSVKTVLLEYDRRFSVHHEDYYFYDYNNPLELLTSWRHSFDIVLADPPFLSEECLTKLADTINFLRKDRFILCTGLTMKNCVADLLKAYPCSFVPQHKHNLANEFACYTNYSSLTLDK